MVAIWKNSVLSLKACSIQKCYCVHNISCGFCLSKLEELLLVRFTFNKHTFWCSLLLVLFLSLHCLYKQLCNKLYQVISVWEPFFSSPSCFHFFSLCLSDISSQFIISSKISFQISSHVFFFLVISNFMSPDLLQNIFF